MAESECQKEMPLLFFFCILMNAGDYKHKGCVPSGEMHIAIMAGKKKILTKPINKPKVFFFVASFVKA